MCFVPTFNLSVLWIVEFIHLTFCVSVCFQRKANFQFDLFVYPKQLLICCSTARSLLSFIYPLFVSSYSNLSVGLSVYFFCCQATLSFCGLSIRSLSFYFVVSFYLCFLIEDLLICLSQLWCSTKRLVNCGHFHYLVEWTQQVKCKPNRVTAVLESYSYCFVTWAHSVGVVVR